MNFYPHHIGDFNNATRHLTRVERSVYRDAIELYYDTESLLSVDFDKLSRRLLCVTDEEKKALNDILNEFFTLKDDGYLHERCDIEIAKYRANTSAKARAGIASAAKRQKKLTHDEHMLNTELACVHNQEPLTNNHKPLKNITAKKVNFFADIPNEILNQWQAVRKKKRGADLSKIVFDAMTREAELAKITLQQAIVICVERNWIAFKADWYQEVSFKNQPDDLSWRNDEAQIMKIARELGVHTQGKSKFEILAKIDEKKRTAK